jgi:hypothetical protein
MATLVDLVCFNCKKDFQREKRQVSASKIHGSKQAFCSSACSAHYNNLHSTREARTSKIERWIQTRVTETFPVLEVHFNRKDAIEGELDIFIPSLKLGIELNGITHYKAVFGEERLKGEQTNDALKRQICKDKGIELLEIDVSKVKEFNSIHFMIAVSTVLDAIKKRLASLQSS